MFFVGILVNPYEVSARSQRAIVRDMCSTAISAAKDQGISQAVIALSGVDEDGNPVPGAPGNSLCNGEYSTLSSEEVTELVQDGLCDGYRSFTGDSLCEEYEEWVANGGDTEKDKAQDKKEDKERENTIRGPVDTICNALKSENPALYNSAAFCRERSSAALRQSSLQNFCNQFADGDGVSDKIKNACDLAQRKGYIQLEFEIAEAETRDVDCKGGGFMGWFLCPAFELGANVTSDAFENVIKPMLENVPVSANRNDPFYKAWSNFRLIGNIILVGAMLVLVYGQLRGGGGR